MLPIKAGQNLLLAGFLFANHHPVAAIVSQIAGFGSNTT
jgi:hypothetical protein